MAVVEEEEGSPPAPAAAADPASSGEPPFSLACPTLPRTSPAWLLLCGCALFLNFGVECSFSFCWDPKGRRIDYVLGLV